MCTSRQPTTPQCDSDKFASCLATEGRGRPEAKIDERVAEEMKKVAPGYLPVQPGAVPPEKTKKDGDGDLLSSRSGSSQGARRRPKHAERANELVTYKEAYEILRGAAGEFNGARGYSSEDDTRGT